MAPPKKRVERSCCICGKKFEVHSCRSSTARFCSNGCKDQANAIQYAKARAEMACKQCGAVFLVPKCHAERRVYCSLECRADAERGVTKPAKANGNVTHHRDGYILERDKDHPFNVSGYVLQHRLIVERWLRVANQDHPFLVQMGEQKYLRPDIQVHHVNEVRSDNGLENLVPCSQRVHSDLHAAMRVAPKRLLVEIVQHVRELLQLPAF